MSVLLTNILHFSWIGLGLDFCLAFSVALGVWVSEESVHFMYGYESNRSQIWIFKDESKFRDWLSIIWDVDKLICFGCCKPE